MWKRDEPVRPTVTPVSAGPGPSPTPMNREEVVSIGKSVIIRGELSSGEDLTIEGQVEGKIELQDHVLTVGSNGRIKAQIVAKAVVVLGQVTGNVTATDKVDVRESGSVEGDITAPRVAIADGAHFRGSIDMQRKGAAAAPSRPAGAPRPEANPAVPVVSPANDQLARA